MAVCSGLVAIQWINLICGQAFDFKVHCQKLNDLVTIGGAFCSMLNISWVDMWLFRPQLYTHECSWYIHFGTFERKPMGHKPANQHRQTIE